MLRNSFTNLLFLSIFLQFNTCSSNNEVNEEPKIELDTTDPSITCKDNMSVIISSNTNSAVVNLHRTTRNR